MSFMGFVVFNPTLLFPLLLMTLKVVLRLEVVVELFWSSSSCEGSKVESWNWAEHF